MSTHMGGPFDYVFTLMSWKKPYKYGCTKWFHHNEELLNIVQFHPWKFKKPKVRSLGKLDHVIDIVGKLSMIMSGISWRLFLDKIFLNLRCWKYWILSKLIRKFKYFQIPKKSNLKYYFHNLVILFGLVHIVMFTLGSTT